MKTKKPKTKFIVEKSEDGFCAYWTSEEYQKAISTWGENMTHLKEMMLDATNLAFEDVGLVYTLDEMHYELDLAQFFEFYSEINAKGLAKRMGVTRSLLAHYIGGQKKPSEKQTAKILMGIRSLGRELAGLEFL